MPPAVDLTAWEAPIQQWILVEGLQHADVLSRLRENGVSIGRATLARRLVEWNVLTRPNTTGFDQEPAQQELEDRIRFIFTKLRLTEKKTLETLKSEGFVIGPSALRRIRKELGLFKRVEAEDQAEVNQTIEQTLRRKYDLGHIENYGRRNLQTHMRKQFNFVGRSGLSKGLSTISAADSLTETACIALLPHSIRIAWPGVSPRQSLIVVRFLRQVLTMLGLSTPIARWSIGVFKSTPQSTCILGTYPRSRAQHLAGLSVRLSLQVCVGLRSSL